MFFEEMGVLLEFVFAPFFVVVEDAFQVGQICWMNCVSLLVEFFVLETYQIIYFFLNLLKVFHISCRSQFISGIHITFGFALAFLLRWGLSHYNIWVIIGRSGVAVDCGKNSKHTKQEEESFCIKLTLPFHINFNSIIKQIVTDPYFTMVLFKFRLYYPQIILL